MLSEPHFHSEEAAFAFCEAQRWPTGPVCPHCRCAGGKVGKLKGRSTRRGTYKCYECGSPFTVKIGTVFESSHLELHLWLQAIYLLSCAKRKISVRQLQQTLGVALKTAWVLHQRIPELIDHGDGLLLVAEEQRSIASSEPLAAAKMAAAMSSASTPAPARAGASKSEPRRNRRARVRRRPPQPGGRQLILF